MANDPKASTMSDNTDNVGLAFPDANDPIFTEDQLHQYERDGFILLPDCFSQDIQASIRQWADEIIAWPEVRGKYMKYLEGRVDGGQEPILRRVENFFPYHDSLHEFALSRLIGGAVAELFGEPVYLFKDHFNLKLSGGDGYRYHQDQRAGWNQFASELIRVSIPVDDMTEYNGCIEIAAGEHKKGLLGPEWEMISDEVVNNLTFRQCPIKLGDALFFSSYAPHGSAPNLSGGSRRTFYFAYTRHSEGNHREQHFADKREIFPPDFERDPDKVYLSGAERHGGKGMGGLATPTQRSS